jgi:DNA-binding GntR family transcriptional regulator
MSVAPLPDDPPDAASARIAVFLRRSILDGEFKPGEFIRQEDIARRLRASRLPVREALRILEAEGLTEHHANRGARVPLLDMHEVDVIYQLRERVEPLVLAESMAAITATSIERCRAILEAIEDGVEIGEFMSLDREFHFLTYSGCRIDSMTTMVVRLWNSTQHHRRLFMQQSGADRRWVVNSEHRLLLDAIERSDTARAEQLLAAHIRRTRTDLARGEHAQLPKSAVPPGEPIRAIGGDPDEMLS